MKDKTTLFFVLLIIGVIALLFWARALSTPTSEREEGRLGYWGDTNVKCLLLGHQNLAQHIHPTMSITIGGESLPIPSNIGNATACMAETHTHDTTGTLHLETIDPQKIFILDEFFAVWGEPLDREGYTRTATVNDQLVEDVGTYVLKDNDRIVLTYTSITPTSTEESENASTTP